MDVVLGGVVHRGITSAVFLSDLSSPLSSLSSSSLSLSLSLGGGVGSSMQRRSKPVRRRCVI